MYRRDLFTLAGKVGLLLLLLASPGWAGNITTVTGAAWPTSGSATTGTTGFSNLTGTWTHVGSADVPIGSPATGYIALAEGASGSFRLDGTTVPFQTGVDHWKRFWLYIKRGTSALPADGTTMNMHDVVSAGTKLRSSIALQNSGTVYDKFAVLASEFMTGGTAVNLSERDVLHFNTWNEITLHLLRDATDGRYEIYVNGVLVSGNKDVDTSTATIADADAKSQWTVNLGGLSGLQFRVAGPVSSWSDKDISVRPRYDLQAENSYRTKRFIHHLARPGYLHGLEFTYAGTATLTNTTYATGGVNPKYQRVVVSGSAGQTAQIMTIDDLGSLPYNEQGWATVLFPDIYLPGTGTTCEFIIRNTTDTGDVLRLTYDGTNLKHGSTVLPNFSKTARMGLAVHFHQSGQATYSLYDDSTFPSVPTWWSGVLENWTPQPLGKAGFSAVYGDTTFEVGSISVHSWLEVACCDSLTTGSTASVTPALQGGNHVTRELSFRQDGDSVPNSWKMRSLWVANTYAGNGGWGRRGIDVMSGRSGLSRANWTTNVLAGMTYTRGVVIWNFDGGSINDVGSSNSAGNIPTKIAALTSLLEQQIQMMLANGNQVVLSPMYRREQGTYTANDHAIVNGYNAAIRSMFGRYRQTGLVWMTEPHVSLGSHRQLLVAGDDVHPCFICAVVLSRDMVRTFTNKGPVRNPRP